MNDRPSDLLTLLSQARQLVTDERHLWCTTSDLFDSRLVQRRGMLLGGALSPHFLRETNGELSQIPWTVHLKYCRVVVCDKAAHEPLAAWLPLMEGIAGAGESLLVVTETIGTELLHTLVVNALKATLPVCVVHPARSRFGSAPGPGMDSLGRACATPPKQHDRLPRIGDVWIRRTATALFPSVGESVPPESVLQNFAIIETGGEHHDDQQARLRFLMRELQPTATK